jgi:HSP20 family protein
MSADKKCISLPERRIAMELKKLVPWNWFKKEDEYHGQSTLPVHRQGYNHFTGPIHQFHREIDRIFDDFFRGFGPPMMGFGRELPMLAQPQWLKPTVDIAASEREYTISVEIPGVEDKDFSLDLSDGTLRIRGEKKLETEEKEKDYYRMERSFGSFQRVVSLPEDVDQDGIDARYANGVLTIKLPRKPKPKTESKKITIKGSEGSGTHKEISD